MRAFLLMLLGVALAVVSVLGLLRFAPEVALGPPKTPSFLWATEAEAQASAEAGGLVLLLGERQHDPQVPAGRVKSQTPVAGAPSERGIVQVVLSLGPEPVPIVVPEILGLDESGASEKLKAAGLRLGEVTNKQKEGDAKVGAIASCDPGMGTEVEDGAAVDVVVWAPGPGRRVPRLYGRSVASARRMLRRRGLGLGRVKITTDIDHPFDIIIGSAPAAGRTVPEGSSVTVIVNEEAQ